MINIFSLFCICTLFLCPPSFDSRGYSSKALAGLLQSRRTIPTNTFNEDTLTQANTVPGQGLVTHSSKYHELLEQKDIFIDVSYICVGDVAGIGVMAVLFFPHALLPGQT